MSVSVEVLRNRLVFAAANQARIGSHYLKGGYGHIFNAQRQLVSGSCVTGHTDISFGCMEAPHTSSGGKPICFAAESNRPNIGPRVCAGRCRHPSVGGRQVAPRTQDADAAAVISIANSCRNPQSYLWPRPANHEHSTDTVNGECCIGVRHFDCIGFVNWCFWSAVNQTRTVSYDIRQWQQANAGVQMLPIGQVQPGDILFGYNGNTNEHIGIAVSTTEVAHSAGWFEGVVQELIRRRNWNPQVARPNIFLNISIGRTRGAERERISSDAESGAFRN